MKESTVEILSTIGWSEVVAKYPETAMNLPRVLNLRRGGPQAKEDLNKILAVDSAIKKLTCALAELPSHITQDVHWEISENAGDVECSQLPVNYTLELFQELLPALANAQQRARAIVSSTGPGSTSPLTRLPRKARTSLADDRPYKIAYALAEIYFLGLRERPKTAGTDALTKNINSKFNRALRDVLESEGFGTRSPNTIVNMGNAARKRLTISKVKKALRKNAATLSRWRNSSFYAIETRKVIWRDLREEEHGLWYQVTEIY